MHCFCHTSSLFMCMYFCMHSYLHVHVGRKQSKDEDKACAYIAFLTELAL